MSEKSINFFTNIMNKQCTIKLHDGMIFKGELKLIDGLMNIVLQNAVEYINMKKESEYAECFIRGNNSLFLFFFFLIVCKQIIYIYIKMNNY